MAEAVAAAGCVEDCAVEVGLLDGVAMVSYHKRHTVAMSALALQFDMYDKGGHFGHFLWTVSPQVPLDTQ